MIDLFNEFQDSDIAYWVDDTIPYSCANAIPTVISQLQVTSAKRF